MLHAGSHANWVPNCTSQPKHRDSKVDCHDEIDSDVLLNWFQNTLLQNLSTNKNYYIILDNGNYHSILKYTTPNVHNKTQYHNL